MPFVSTFYFKKMLNLIPYFNQTTPAEQTKIVTNCKISAFEELCFHADYDRCSDPLYFSV